MVRLQLLTQDGIPLIGIEQVGGRVVVDCSEGSREWGKVVKDTKSSICNIELEVRSRRKAQHPIASAPSQARMVRAAQA